MTEPADLNPYAPPPDTKPESWVPELINHQSRWLRNLCLAQSGLAVVALVAEVYDIETIVGTGPVFGIMGLSLAVSAWRRGDTQMTLFGASAPSFAMFVFLLINVMQWSPTDADQPVQLISFAYAFFALPFAWWLLARRATGYGGVGRPEPVDERPATDS